ncbi:hypothetical protein ACFL3V_04590 [Nanoarchaeota archaeon]
MDEISNKTLATLLVVAIVISLAGTFFAMRGVTEITNIITGKAATGSAKVHINETASVNLIASTVDFSSGYRNASVVTVSQECNLTSSAAKPTCWAESVVGTYDPQDFDLENDGNVFVNVTIKSDAASTAFFDNCTTSTIIDGDQNYTWTGKDSSASTGDTKAGCTEDAADLVDDETDFTTTELLLCANLSDDDENDQFNVTVKLYVPAGPAGFCGQSVTFTAVRST